jgi:hypothetical protein
MSVTLVGIRAVGLLIARCGNEATRCSGGAAHRHGLGTCHSKGAAIVVEGDATTLTKFFLVRFIAMKRDFRLLKKVTGPYNVWVVWLKV